MTDKVNHPDYYQADNGLEAIDVMEAFFYDNPLLFNAQKYLIRAGKKTQDPTEDLEKAIWYIRRYMDTRLKFSLTDKGKAVMELRNAGIEVPFVKNIGFRYENGSTRILQDDGGWANEDGWVLSTKAIIDIVKDGRGAIVDLDEPEKKESNLRQQAIEELRQAGHFVPEGERLFYVNAEGSAWKLNDNGKWVGRIISLSTEDVKRYLVCDGVDVKGTIRTSDHGFRVLREVLNFPEEGDRIEDVDGDFWEFNGLSWIFEDLKKSTEEVMKYHGPVSLPDEEPEPAARDLRQEAIDKVKAAGYSVPEGDNLYYVNPNGSAWLLSVDGEWYNDNLPLTTDEVIEYLKDDGLNTRGTLRTSCTGFRTLWEVLGDPKEGEKVRDRDNDHWTWDGHSWRLVENHQTSLNLSANYGPLALPEEEV